MAKSDRRNQVNFRLDEELAEALQIKCDELGITQTEFAKTAIRAALGLPAKEIPIRLKIDALEEIREEFKGHLSSLERRLESVEQIQAKLEQQK